MPEWKILLTSDYLQAWHWSQFLYYSFTCNQVHVENLAYLELMDNLGLKDLRVRKDNPAQVDPEVSLV